MSCGTWILSEFATSQKFWTTRIVTLEQSLLIKKTLHMHVGFGMLMNGYIQIWMFFFDTLMNTGYSKDHIMLCSIPFFYFYYQSFLLFCMLHRSLRRHWSMCWMWNPQKNAWTSYCWQMRCSSCGKVSSFNGRCATTLMDLKMYQHVYQNQLTNPLSIIWQILRKLSYRSWRRGSLQKQ